MGSITQNPRGRVEQANVPGILGNHTRRIEILEALVPPVGFGSYSSRILADPNLVAYWKMDDPGPITIDGVPQPSGVTDYGPNDYRGAQHDTPLYHQSGPQIDELPFSVEFFGPRESGASNSFLGTGFSNAAALASFNGPAVPMTVEAWINFQPYPDVDVFNPIVSKFSQAGTDNGWWFAIEHQTISGPIEQYRLSFARANTGSTTEVSTDWTLFTPGTWFYVVAVHDPVAAKDYIYVDGILIAETPDSQDIGSVGATDLKIGACVGSAGTETYHFRGFLSNIAVYSAALTEETIQNHYAGGLSPESLATAPITTTRISSGPALANWVLYADGAGGCFWGPLPP